MKPFIHTLVVLAAAALAGAETVYFTDGTHIEVSSYEIRERVVILVTADGKLRSVPRSLVVIDALADEETMIAEAIELVGLRRLTDEIAVSALQAASSPEVEASKLLIDAMSEGFAPEQIYRVAEEVFRENASGVNLSAALDGLRSPIARRIERVELNRGDGSLDSYLAELESSPPSAARVELLLRLDRASGTSEAAVEMQAAMMKALFAALHGDAELAERAVDDARPKLAARTRNRIQVSLHFMYRDISDAELELYLGYLESESGAWLSGVLLKSLFAAMEEGARRSGEALAERLHERTKLKVEVDSRHDDANDDRCHGLRARMQRARVFAGKPPRLRRRRG